MPLLSRRPTWSAGKYWIPFWRGEAEKMGARILYQTPLVQYRAFSDRVEIATREASFSSPYLILAHGAYDLLSGPFRFPGAL